MALRDQSEVSEKKKMKIILLRLTLSNDLMSFWTFGDLPSCLVQRLVPLGRVFHLKSSKVKEEAKSLLWHTAEFCCILSLDIPQSTSSTKVLENQMRQFSFETHKI